MQQKNDYSGEKQKLRKAAKKIGARLLSIGPLYLIALMMVIPFVWTLSTSLTKFGNVYKFPPEWIPHPIVWKNYIEGWNYAPFIIYLKNSTLITSSVLIGTLLSNSLIAYAFACLKAPGRNFLFILVLSTMMIPYAVLMVPLYSLFRQLGWINTFKPLIVPAFFGNAFFIFLLRQFFLSIPRSLIDAAKIDGCGPFGIYWRIMLPLIKPALVTVAILSVMGTWNDFMAPLIYLNSATKYTLTLGLASFQSQYGGYRTELIMAVTIIVTTPLLVLFFFAQKYFIRGVIMTGLKG